MSLYTGYFFDGHSSKRIDVKVDIQDLMLCIYDTSDILIKKVELSECNVYPPVGKNPIIITVLENSRIELIYDKKFLSSVKIYMNQFERLAHYLESNLQVFIVTLCSFFVILFFLFTVVIPLGSARVAQMIPEKVAEYVDRASLEQLDKLYLKTSSLDENLQKKLLIFFKEHKLEKYSILFRKSKAVGANAFALAGKTIIVTDSLVRLLNKKELLAIVLHEVSHIENRDVLSSMISASSFAVLATTMFGTMSGGIENLSELSVVLLARKFSQSLETRADEFSAKNLRSLNYSSKCFTHGLRRIVGAGKISKSKESSSFIESFSTHPSVLKRINHINNLYPNQSDCTL